jgi:hypothetical protein
VVVVIEIGNVLSRRLPQSAIARRSHTTVGLLDEPDALVVSIGIA